ncbi:Chaperone DnaJ-domain superfamily protein [Hirschfeldia incana]|nr:Chaperone DnaJ-domain superfamily protein [Hirschfeldia incana]
MVVSGDDTGAEADRWLITAKELLSSSDFKGAKALAISSCEDDPSRAHAADYIIAISDTLLAGESTVGGDSKLPDWYAVLRLDKLTQSLEHIAVQYRRLALLLNPTVNRLPFADRALKLVSDAWCVLSDPPRKSIYDQELQLSRLGQPQSQPEQFQSSRAETSATGQPQSQPEQFKSRAETSATSFWTACPYCYALFEYPKGYEECALRCQQCGRAFEAVKTETPPVESNGQGVYFFCSWAVFPVGFSGDAKISGSGWSPVSHLFHCPVVIPPDHHQSNVKTPAPRNCPVDGGGDEFYITISDDDEERDHAKTNKKGG